MRMPTLSFTGKSGSGKDHCARLAAEIAREELGKRLLLWPLARLVKARIYGEGRGLLTYAQVFLEKTDEMRARYQQVGSDEGRDVFGQGLWTLQLEAVLEDLRAQDLFDAVSIPDVRYPNELEFALLGLRDPGQVIWELLGDAQAELDREAGGEGARGGLPTGAQVALDHRAFARASERYQERLRLGSGIALYVASNRPTLTGKRARHSSENSLSQDDSRFAAVIHNPQGASPESLRKQLRPHVYRLFGEEPHA